MCAHFILLNTGPWLRREWKSKTYCWGHQSSCDRAPEVWCPSKLTNRFWVFISRMGFRNMNFSCLSSVFRCFTQNLVILEHCQHKMSMHWWETECDVPVPGIPVPGNLSLFLMVSEPVSEKFGTEKSPGTGLGFFWYRKKSRNRSRKILVPKKSLGIGIVQILGLVTHCAPQVVMQHRW